MSLGWKVEYVTLNGHLSKAYTDDDEPGEFDQWPAVDKYTDEPVTLIEHYDEAADVTTWFEVEHVGHGAA